MSKETTKVVYDGVVLYADGSYMMQTGKLGAGIHGYTYSKEEPKKGAGADKDILTASGYVAKAFKDKVKQVTPINYINIVAPTAESGSNNTAEIYGAAIALEHCKGYLHYPDKDGPLSYGVKSPKVTLYTDSMYVVDGINKHSAKWIRNNWIKPDGTEIKNRSMWERLINASASFSNLEIKWVKGHSDHLGNIMADKLADIARLKSEDGNFEVDTKTPHPDGYWKKGTERHPLLALHASFFFTEDKEPKKGEYFLTNMVKSDEFIGVSSADMCVGVVQLKEPDETIEMVRERQMEYLPSFNSMILTRLDRIFQGQKADDLKMHGKYCLVRGRRPGAVDLYFTGETGKMTSPKEGTPITEMLFPPMLAHRVAEEAGILQVILRTYLEKGTIEQDDIEIVDFTATLLKPASDPKKGFDFTAELKSENNLIRLETQAFGHTVQIPIVFGTHLINKNNIRRFAIEQGGCKLLLVLQKESPEVLRYYVIIAGKDEASIWGSPHNNHIYFKVMRLKTKEDTKLLKASKLFEEIAEKDLQDHPKSGWPGEEDYLTEIELLRKGIEDIPTKNDGSSEESEDGSE